MRDLTLNQISDAIISLGAVAAALLVLGALFTKAFVRPITKALDEHIESVLHELQPNNGSSLRDSSDRMEAQISKLSELVASIDGRQQKIDAVQDRVVAALTKNQILLGD